MQILQDIQKQLAAAKIGSTEWAFLQMQLGDVLQEMDESPEGQEVAIRAYHHAMSVYSLEVAPEQWAQIAIRQATVYLYRITGVRSQNLKITIELSQKALTFLPQLRYQEDWSIAPFNIGTAWLNLMTGNRSSNIEKGIAILRGLRSSGGASEEQARVQNQLGMAYLYRIAGERGDNLEAARGFFEATLQVFTIKADAIAWAQAQTNLATVYLQRTQGERSANLETAITIYKEILKVFAPERFPLDWAKIQANLGETYRNRIQGDKSQNLEDAIDACRAALQVFTKARFPVDWARNHIHLGNIYLERLIGDPAQNIENAITAFEEAFRIYAEQSTEYPIEWGYAQVALGMAYRKRTLADPAANSQKAIQAYQAALTVFTAEKYPEEWARVNNNLGNAHVDSPAGDHDDNIDQAIAAFAAALEVIKQDQYPHRWSMLQNNLGFAHLARGHGDHNLVAAEKAFLLALQERARDRLPVEFIRTSRLLGETNYHQKQFEKANVQFRQALDAADDLRHLATNVISHLYISQDMADTFQMAIDTTLRLGKITEAALLTIAAKSRTLAGRMSAIAITGAKMTEPEVMVKMQQLQALDKEIHWYDGSEQIRDQLRVKRKELMDRMTVDYPALAPIRYFEPATEAEVWQQIAGCGNLPVLDYVQHAGGWGVFIYAQGKINYTAFDEAAVEKVGKIATQIQQEKFWDKPDYQFQLRECYELVFAPLRPFLPEYGQLLICPTGSLHQLPFHALSDDKNIYLSDNYAMNFVYSLSMLPVLLHNQPQTRPAKTGCLLNIAHPGFKGDPHFTDFKKIVAAEMAAVADCFRQVTSLFETEATPGAAIAQANRQPWEVIHINSHGVYNGKEPSHSGLKLQAPTLLTVQDILLQIKLQGRPLVTLSACQSGQILLQEGEENIGLVSAFLIAGASAVISSLWQVPVGPTKLLMEHFYTLRSASDRSDAQLLQTAIRAIRAIQPYKNPRCWAAFQLTGLPNI